jgi:hypothetical protein
VKRIAEFTRRLILGMIQHEFLFGRSHCLTGILNSDLSERLNLSRDEGEKWIVNLIRETRMGADAKIDLENVCTIHTPLASSPI